MLAIDVQQVSKYYGSFHCLNKCSFEVEQGQVFGLLGPNGAGKTTLIRTLLGYIHLSGGQASILGHDIKHEQIAVRSVVSYLPGDARLMRGMRGTTVLRLLSEMHPCGDLNKSLEVADSLGLESARHVMFMSTGMRQKLALSLVLGTRAPLVILDEPTANLDPNVRRTVIEHVMDMRNEGRTVLLSSHIFSDIDEACDAVVILKDGAVCVCESADEFKNRHCVDVVGDLQAFEQFTNTNQCPNLRRVSACHSSGFRLHLTGNPQSWLGWVNELVSHGFEIESLTHAGVASLYDEHYRPSDSGVAKSA